MKKILFIILSILLFFSSSVFGAGSYTITSPGTKEHYTVEIVWISDGSGDVSGTKTVQVSGVLLGVEFIPGTGLSDEYVVTVTNANGVDVLMGVGASCSNVATGTGNFRTPLTSDGAYIDLFKAELKPVVAAAGPTKTGTIRLYIKRFD